MANDDFPDRRPERPRVEPEIIPPGRHGRGGPGGAGVWMHVNRDGMRRVVITRPGLPAIIAILLIVGLLAAVAFLVLAGVVLFWIPVLVIGIALALLSGAVRYRWRRLLAWWRGAR